MAPISLKKGEIDDLAEELIRCIAGLQEGTENFKLASRFVLSNFRFHRFLDVNSFDIARKLNGIKEKFLVHCKESSANQLTALKDKYLSQPFSSSLLESRTEEHYGVLSLLLNLSESPVNNVDFLPKSKLLTEGDGEEDQIEWSRYLLEGEEDLSLGAAISDEQRLALEDIEDGDDDDYSDDNENLENSAREVESEKRSLENQRSIRSFRDSGMFQEYEPYVEENEDLQWLQKHIIPQYWKGNSNSLTNTPTNELAVDSLIPLEHNRSVCLVTENTFVRETLWMLQGVANTYIYRYNNGKYVVREDVILSHASQGALFSIALDFAASGAKMQQLKEFVASVANVSTNQLRTRRAFGFAINRFISKSREEFASFEFEMVNKEKPMTILELKQAIETLLSNIDLVFDVFTSCITTLQAEDVPGNDAAMHIIDTLFNTVCRLDGFGSTASPQVSIMVPILLETLRPFLGDLARWVMFGILPPIGNEEFFVYEDVNSCTDDSEAWKKRFCIRHCWSDDTKLAVPQFLQEIADKALLTGKSCSILEQATTNANEQVSYTFEEEFFEKLFSGLGISWKKDFAEKNLESNPTLISKDVVFVEKNSHRLLIENFIVLFQRNYEIFHKNKNSVCKLMSIHDMIESEKEILAQNAPCRSPFMEVFKSSLHSMINTRYMQASNTLLHLLTVRFRFDDHFHTIKNFFLMEAGDVLSEFYSEIFTKMRAKEYWQSTSYLTSVFQDALQLRFPHLINKLTVSVQTESGKIRNSTHVQSVDVICLQYAMKWPLTIIFDKKAEEMYNAVFAFLLQVKRALWSLEQLRIKDLQKDNPVSNDEEPLDFAVPSRLKKPQLLATLRQKMYILRMRLLHFVQSFHTYIMTRILHSSGLEFKAKLCEAKDFEEILLFHQDFLEKVHDRCLLSIKVGFAREAIMRILNLSLNFQRQWDLGILIVKEPELQAIENEFDKCSHFIQSFLGNLIKRGSFPHLELLSLLLKI